VPIKLDMLKAFRVVAEQGSLIGAAAALGRTPSAISMTLAQLETQVGGPLFETDRKNNLTPLGQLVLEESNRATDAFTQSIEAIARHAKSTAGTVRIACVPTATINLLPRVIAEFSAQRPDVRLEISDVDSAAVSRRVRTDKADIGIISAAPDALTDSQFILEDALGIVCRSDGPIAQSQTAGSSLSWDALALEPFISNPLCERVHHPTVARLYAASTLEARNTTALLSFVRNGLGATILPFSALEHQPDGLVFFAPTDPETRRTLCKIRMIGRHLSPAAAAFWSLL
jgi:DNA-binding transcriptional LysR family regulator